MAKNVDWNTVVQYGALAGIFVGLTAPVLPLAMVGSLVMVAFGLPGDQVHRAKKPKIDPANPKNPAP